MKPSYMTIRLVDANSGEIIYETKSQLIGTLSYLRSKIDKNLQSFVRFLADDTSSHDICFQVLLHEQRHSLAIFDGVY